jgi:hypothetical protein
MLGVRSLTLTWTPGPLRCGAQGALLVPGPSWASGRLGPSMTVRSLGSSTSAAQGGGACSYVPEPPAQVWDPDAMLNKIGAIATRSSTVSACPRRRRFRGSGKFGICGRRHACSARTYAAASLLGNTWIGCTGEGNPARCVLRSVDFRQAGSLTSACIFRGNMGLPTKCSGPLYNIVPYFLPYVLLLFCGLYLKISLMFMIFSDAIDSYINTSSC